MTAWEEVQAVGNYFINTLSSSGGTGGGSATFNGSAYRFTLSNPGSVAQQHIVSINGVIQKPNSGTSQPSEGFAIDNADIIFAAAPATGSEFFIVTVGTSVNIGAPSNDTINNAMVKADAAIAGTKISPDFGSQNVVTTGSVAIGTSSPDKLLHLSGADTAVIRLENTDTSLTADQIIGGLEFEKRDGSGAGAGVVGGLRMYSEGAVGESAYLTLSTRQVALQMMQRHLRIDSSGNVKIGTRTSQYSFLTPNSANLQIDGGKVLNRAVAMTPKSSTTELLQSKFGTGGTERLQHRQQWGHLDFQSCHDQRRRYWH